MTLCIGKARKALPVGGGFPEGQTDLASLQSADSHSLALVEIFAQQEQ
jgi:hypothetical protein